MPSNSPFAPMSRLPSTISSTSNEEPDGGTLLRAASRRLEYWQVPGYVFVYLVPIKLRVLALSSRVAIRGTHLLQLILALPAWCRSKLRNS